MLCAVSQRRTSQAPPGGHATEDAVEGTGDVPVGEPVPAGSIVAEQAFFNVGPISDVEEKWAKMQKEMD